MTDDLLPVHPKGRAIVLVLGMLEQSVIRSTLQFDWHANPSAWLTVTPSKAGAAQPGADHG
jgi:hypothetical protein